MYTSEGKQVLKDGQHYADAVTVEAAQEIVEALNYDREGALWVEYYRGIAAERESQYPY